ncbi:unnamed protein product [Ectocarpus sp. CCAP 1310/34]|nr:unnamed protein product [Ectocarpus sp. CCAP 1310/34]
MRLLCWSPYLMVCYLLPAHGFVRQRFRTRTGPEGHRTGYGRGGTSTATSTRPTTIIACAASSTTAVDSSAVEDKHMSCSSFRHCSTVYIEMTDMYRIVYHANYVTYAQRAIEHAFGAPGVRVHSLPIVKYRAAATLGDEIAVQGTLVSCDDSSSGGGRSRWRFELAAASDPSRVFVTAEATVSWPGGAAMPPGVAVIKLPRSAEPTMSDDTELLQPLPEAFTDPPKALKVVVWSDDLDVGGNLSIRAVLNYFERIRTLSLGRGQDGELGLMRLHREGVSVVVTSISDLRVNSDGLVAGETLDVRLGAKLSRGNRVMTMYESLWKENGTLVAHAEIALFCMDNETRKFRPVPEWVQVAIMLPSAVL